jgi:hypothetical protein
MATEIVKDELRLESLARRGAGMSRPDSSDLCMFSVERDLDSSRALSKKRSDSAKSPERL